jgi:hypothetical protein
MNAQEAVRLIREKNGLDADAKVGVVSSFGHEVQVKAEGGRREILVTANTSDIDLENEVVVPEGADTSYFEANGKVFRDHCYGIDDCVGAIRRGFPKMASGAWQVRIGLNGSPVADAAFAIAEADGIGVSIGFDATDWGSPTDEEADRYAKGGKPPKSIVRSWKWLELSVTCLPCNVSCQTLEVSGVEKSLGTLDRLVTKGIIDRDTARKFGLPDKPTAVARPKAHRTIIYPDGHILVPVRSEM